ncbi:MAG: recombinase family protein [Candidatus Nanopelagicales bacterium]
MKAVAYTRVSTDEQGASGLGLEAQAAACQMLAMKLGAELVATHADQNVGGATGLEHRPGLLLALGELGRGDALLVAKRDRLGRDPIVIAMIEAAARRRGARILSAAGEGTESDGPADVLMRRIVDAFAEYERLVIGARTKAALQAKRRRGERAGAVPFGYRADEQGRLTTDPREVEILGLVRELKGQGWSVRKIACELNDRAIPARGAKWHPTTIARLLKAS